MSKGYTEWHYAGSANHYRCILLAVSIAATGCACANDRPERDVVIRRGALTAASILIGPDGAAYPDPTSQLGQRLNAATVGERAEMMDALITIVEQSGGYARVVAARAVLDHWVYVRDRQRATRVIAHTAIRLRRPSESSIPDEWLDDPADQWYALLAPYCAIDADNRAFEFYDRLPPHWLGVPGEVEIDGQTVATSPTYASPDFPVEYVNVRSVVKKRDYAEHTITCRLVITSPTGETALVVDSRPFTTAPLEDFR